MPSIPTAVTVSDLLYQLGDIPASRVRLQPIPGTATEADVVTVHDQENRLCELVDGVLVWLVNPETETITVHTARHQSIVLDTSAMLEGRAVLPGFTLPIHTLFTEPGR